MRRRRLNLSDIDTSWTLFLDRDGIINRHLEGTYVLKWNQFEFIPSFLKSISGLGKLFGKIIVVTNQRCVSKRELSAAGLKAIHKKMLAGIKSVGGKIDKIYVCPHGLEADCSCRKPKIGMALKAKKDFKDIDLKKSIVVGNSPSDIEFGKNAGMTTVLISRSAAARRGKNADYCFTTIGGFYSFLKKALTVKR